jgi:phage/plasmid-like protein (TIGR03299 family)
MEIAGLDYEVELRPMEAVCEIREGETLNVTVPDFRASVRTDRNQVLGVVGSSYEVLQNEAAFSTLDPLLDAGLASIETAGALRMGRDVWMQVGLKLDLPGVFKTGEVKPYLLLSNNHSGERKAQIQHTCQRVVCANTLGYAHQQAAWGIDRAIKIFHRANVKSATASAVAEMIATLTVNFTTIAAQYEVLRGRFLAEEEFAAAVLDVLAPMPAKPEGERATKNNIATAAWERASDRATTKRNRLSTLWVEGDGHSGDHSAWEALNGAVQSIDHDTDLWKVDGDSRLASLWQGQLGKAKQAVTDSLYTLATR